ncbi:MAG: hypothetical protein IT198_02835 [Acidimicrobiia bacterium]|nr:hypothetical protein [Acidimicrobiia bacterium]
MSLARHVLDTACAAAGFVAGGAAAAVTAIKRAVNPTRPVPGPIDPTRAADTPHLLDSAGEAEISAPRTPTATEIGLAIHRDAILGLRADLGATDTHISDLLLRREGRLAMYYAPLDPVAAHARLVLLGTTPSADVVAHALRAARSAILAGMPDTDVLARARVAALSPVRGQLETLLDDIGLREILGAGPAALLDTREIDVTWAVRSPVSLEGGTYTGTRPSIGASEMLRNAVSVDLAAELDAVPATPVIPLGEAATEALDLLVDVGLLAPERALPTVPDPASANAIRLMHFREDGETLEQIRKRIRMLVSPSD